MDTRSRAKSDINITPLIDIVLVLLIVFIVMVPGLSRVLQVSVPRVEITKDKPIDVPLVVSLDKDGKLFLQREEVTVASLGERLVPVVMLQPANLRKVFLKVHGEIAQEQAVRVLDQIRVASDKVKAETKARRLFAGNEEGSDIKVAISLLKGDTVV